MSSLAPDFLDFLPISRALVAPKSKSIIKHGPLGKDDIKRAGELVVTIKDAFQKSGVKISYSNLYTFLNDFWQDPSKGEIFKSITPQELQKTTEIKVKSLESILKNRDFTAWREVFENLVQLKIERVEKINNENIANAIELYHQLIKIKFPKREKALTSIDYAYLINGWGTDEIQNITYMEVIFGSGYLKNLPKEIYNQFTTILSEIYILCSGVSTKFWARIYQEKNAKGKAHVGIVSSEKKEISDKTKQQIPSPLVVEDFPEGIDRIEDSSDDEEESESQYVKPASVSSSKEASKPLIQIETKALGEDDKKLKTRRQILMLQRQVDDKIIAAKSEYQKAMEQEIGQKQDSSKSRIPMIPYYAMKFYRQCKFIEKELNQSELPTPSRAALLLQIANHKSDLSKKYPMIKDTLSLTSPVKLRRSLIQKYKEVRIKRMIESLLALKSEHEKSVGSVLTQEQISAMIYVSMHKPQELKEHELMVVMKLRKLSEVERLRVFREVNIPANVALKDKKPRY